ncbi:uncharacterized protein LOC142324594 [Lycorma delicatula]|uniref:uncharacterized protein LOC142324594 n=1 Tax=Lycorma delicatula TaxID=130591 RepID=UPI003F50FAEA
MDGRSQDNFFKNISENVDTRQKNEFRLQNEAIYFREQFTSMLINLQDIVHPGKFKMIEQIKQRLQEEATNLKAINNIDQYPEINDETMREDQLCEINNIIEKAEKFLESYKNNNNNKNGSIN